MAAFQLSLINRHSQLFVYLAALLVCDEDGLIQGSVTR